VLLSGACLVASTEVLRKLPQWHRLPHGYGCVAVNNVHDDNELSGKLAAVVRRPELAKAVGARGRAFAQNCQEDVEFPARLEEILSAAAQRRPLVASPAAGVQRAHDTPSNRFPLTRMAAAHAGIQERSSPQFARVRDNEEGALEWSRLVLAALRSAVANGRPEIQSFAQAVEVEIGVAAAAEEMQAQSRGSPDADPLFRVDIAEWAWDGRALGSLMLVRSSGLRVLRFDFDISELREISKIEEFPKVLRTGPSFIVLGDRSAPNQPLSVDQFTARILELSDGTLTADQIVRRIEEELGSTGKADHLAWIEKPDGVRPAGFKRNAADLTKAVHTL